MRLRYDMFAVHRAVKGISREQLRKAVGSGQDSAPVRLTFFDPERRPEGAPKPQPLHFPEGVPKFKIEWECTQTPDGDVIGRLVWDLLGQSGTFPVVVDYVGDVPEHGEPTYFSRIDAAEQQAADCAKRLREQFAQMFQEPE